MSRIHGRNGMVYVGVSASDQASPSAFIADWTMNFIVAKVDVTAMGDPNLIWAGGLPDASGDFTGFYDTATAQTYVAAIDGQPRKFYLYPNLQGVGAQPNEYFFGTILPDFSVAGGVASAVTLKSTWNAASPVRRYSASVDLNATQTGGVG